MKREKKKNLYLFLFIILALIGVGYAAIATQLKVDGVLNVARTEWDVHLENIQINSNSVTANPAPVINNNTTTELNYTIQFETPGDFYEFTVDVVNNGTIDAMVGAVTNKVYQGATEINPAYIKSEVTYADGIDIAPYHKLAKKTGNTATTEKLKVRVEFRKDIEANQLPTTSDVTVQLKFNATYEQADSNAVKVFRLEVGDYVSLTPDKVTYEIPKELTGYDSDQTINIAGTSDSDGLRLWRVIDKHEDGSVDVVSEYVSYDKVYFKGVTGYVNYVGALNIITSQFEKEGYTIGSRYMGYDGQTEYLTDTSAFDGSTNTAPSTTDTPAPKTGTGEEYSGGALGDSLYLKDYQLVGNVYKSDTATYGTTGLKAYQVGTTTPTNYLIASRDFSYVDETIFAFNGRMINNSGSLSMGNTILYMSNWYDSENCQANLRPVLILKSGLTKSGGTGTKADPYTFN